MSPFAELHIHLEGSIQPETLAEIDPSLQPEEISTLFRFEKFGGFIQAYIRILKLLQTPEHYRVAARALRQQLAQQNITYAEVNLSVGAMIFLNRDTERIIEAVQDEFPGWPLIFDAVRQHDPKIAIQVAELAQNYQAAFGIGGDETAQPLSKFSEAISLVPGKFIPHAGEISTANSVWEALKAGAIRIGHGIRAIEDPALCIQLRNENIPLEISLTSNVITGAIGTLDAHPVRKLFDAGVPITLNTDDPALFQTTLSREFELARNVFGFSSAELEQIRQNSFHFAIKSHA